MNKILITALILLLFSCSNKQASNSKTVSKSDSIFLDKYYKEASEIQYSNIDSAKKLYQHIGEVVRKSQSPKALLNYYRVLSAFYGLRLNNLSESKKYLDSAWLLASQQGNENLRYKAYFIEGRYHMASDNILLASKSFLKSIECQKKPIDTLILLVTYSDLAKIYFLQHNYSKSVIYYKPLMEYDARMKDTASMINNYLNYYAYVSHAQNTDSALQYLYKAKSLTSISKYKSLHHILLFNFSVYYFSKNKLDSALIYINDAIKEQENKMVSPENFFKFSMLKVQILIDKKNFYLADQTLKHANDKIELDKIELSYQANYYSTLYQLQKAKNNFSEALEALEKRREIQEEIDKYIQDEQLQNHEKELKLLAANHTIEVKNNQITRQRLFTIILSITCILICIIAVLYYQHFKKIKKIETLKWEQKEKDKELENEKILLKNQIEERNRISQEMHDDLGSTLTTISMAVELFNLHPTNDVPLQIINQSTNELSNKINEIVWSLNVQNDTLLSLIAYFRKFARNFLGDAKIALKWEEKEKIEESNIQGFVRRVIFLSLKEILNNIVRHSEATEVFIKIENENNFLKITIKDNGVGLKDEKGNEHFTTGHGLNNIKKGISKLGGTVEYLMDHGTIVILNIPI